MAYIVRKSVARASLLALLAGTLLLQPFGSSALLLAPTAFAQAVSTPDPTLLPVATLLQSPLVGAYAALNVPGLPAGGSYQDPTTNVKVYKLTSATFPTTGYSWTHSYSEGGDEVSLPHTGTTRTIHLYNSSGWHWLIDFTPGVGVSNPRMLDGVLKPWMDLAFAFSSNPTTPYYAYTATMGGIRRFDVRTMTEVPGNGWPLLAETNASWLHQSANDAFFVWMRGVRSTPVVGYEPATGTLKTFAGTGYNMIQPRVDRAGRYVGITLDAPNVNGAIFWDWLANSVVWVHPGDPTAPFAHIASLKRRWLGVQWNEGPYPPPFYRIYPDVPSSAVDLGTGATLPANATQVHGSGNWNQNPTDLRDQWAVFLHYGSLVPTGTWLAPGGMVLITENGQRRLLAHSYNTSANYTFFSFAKFSPDGNYVLFTSDMNGSPRSDVFLAELPTSAVPVTPPTVSLTAPANGATVSGAAVTVAAAASGAVPIAGVQFTLDGMNLSAEVTSAPYTIAWNTLTVTNGSHTLAAVARNTTGLMTASVPVTVTVNNALSPAPTVISSVVASSITVSGAVITWTTNNPSDSQVDYGPTTSYGSTTPVNPNLVMSHSVMLSGLASGALYHYRVKSKDATANTAVSPDFTFMTISAVSPTPPPVISSVVSSVTSSGATITWTTDRPSDSQVDYGLTTSYGTTTPVDPTLVTAHAVTLTGLASGTPYHYRVKSKDATANMAVSPDFVFTTAVVSSGVPPTPAPSSGGSGGTPPSGGGGTSSGGPSGGGGGGSGGSPGGGGGFALVQNPGGPSGGLASAGSGAPSSGGASDPRQDFPGLIGVPTPSRPQPVVWSSLVNVTASGNSLTKSSGCDGCADAGALSQQQIASGGGYLEFTASEASSLRTIGFKSASPEANASEVPYAIRLKPDRIAEVREQGMVRTMTAYARGDVFRIAIVAGEISYYKNGRLLYISGLPPTYPLVVSASLQNRGATVANAIIAGRFTPAAAPPTDTVTSGRPPVR